MALLEIECSVCKELILTADDLGDFWLHYNQHDGVKKDYAEEIGYRICLAEPVAVVDLFSKEDKQWLKEMRIRP